MSLHLVVTKDCPAPSANDRSGLPNKLSAVTTVSQEWVVKDKARRVILAHRLPSGATVSQLFEEFTVRAANPEFVDGLDPQIRCCAIADELLEIGILACVARDSQALDVPAYFTVMLPDVTRNVISGLEKIDPEALNILPLYA